MYCKYYGFTEEPFQLTPDPQFLFLDEVYREAMAHLEYGVKTGRGFVLLTGEVGTGKTTLVHSFLDRNREGMITAFIFSTAMNFVELLKMIHEDLDTGVEGYSESYLLIELNRFLLERYREGKKTVIIFDEAQNLSVELLEKIRMLSNLEARKAKLIQLVLVGQPELAEKLEMEELRQLKQRVAVRFDLPHMTIERTLEYIEHRLTVAGAPGRELFTPDALRKIHEESNGIPRLINVICSNALLFAFGDELSVLDESVVDEVVKDLSRGVPERKRRKETWRGEKAAVSGSQAQFHRPLMPDCPLTADEAASYLRVSTKTVRHLLSSGAVPAMKIGRSWRVLKADLDGYIRHGAAVRFRAEEFPGRVREDETDTIDDGSGQAPEGEERVGMEITGAIGPARECGPEGSGTLPEEEK